MAKLCYSSHCQEHTTNDHHYCDRHECSSALCLAPGVPELCIYHGECEKYPCDSYRVPEEDARFCKEHEMTCEKRDCFEPMGQDDPTPYCYDHTCRSEGCNVSLPGENDPPYCRSHRCRLHGCDEPAVNRVEGRRYCTLHACEQTGCREPADRAEDTHDESPFCNRHR
ncbi:hypothetical protein IMZ48_05950 [Candidatus Bathyarchaeota archaeon]|nr:hypothetical protein [Candidatus Bathyarchaeota archaeon]